MTDRHEGAPTGFSGRRAFLVKTLGVAAATAAGMGLSATPASAELQSDWRFCEKCYELFFSGYGGGWCPAGGQHRAQGWNFRLPYNVPSDQNHQTGWRFCQNCFALFYEPAGDSPCAAGGRHIAQGWTFVLAHGVGETPTRQQHWRYCWYCRCLFYWGYPTNGDCIDGIEHVAQGFDFSLDHW